MEITFKRNIRRGQDLYDTEANWKVTVDSTDHINFFCPKCNKNADPIRIRAHDNWAWIELVCNDCKIKGHRKFAIGPLL